MDMNANKYKLLQLLVVSLIVSGAVLFLSYASDLSLGSPAPLATLFVGVGFLSVGSALLYVSVSEEHSEFFIVLLYLLALTLLLQNSFRFEVLSGADNLWEYRVARDTLMIFRWPTPAVGTGQMFSSYYSSLAISIFPAIMAEISGMNLVFTFQFIFNILGASIPVLLFLVTRRALGEIKVAALASILYTQSEYFIQNIPTHIKMMISLIFLLLVLLVIFENTPQRRMGSLTFHFLSFIFMFGIIVSHYYVVYFSIALFLALAIVPFLVKWLPKKLATMLKLENPAFAGAKSISTGYLFFSFIVLTFSWFIFGVPWLFNQNINMAKQAFLSLVERKGSLLIVQYNPLTFQPRGPIVSYWFVLLILLSYIALLYFWLRVPKDAKHVLWVSAGTALAFVFFLILLVPGVTNFLSPERAALMANLFLYSFLAIVILACVKSLRKSRLRMLIECILIVFVVMNLVVNLRIPAYQNMILYNGSSSIPIEERLTQAYNTKGGLVLSEWISSNLASDELISTDARGFSELFYSDNAIVTVITPKFANDSSFLALPYYYVTDNVWVVAPGTPGTLVVLKVNMTTDIFSISNKIFDDGEYSLLARTK